ISSAPPSKQTKKKDNAQAIGVYDAGLYIANLTFWFGESRPGAIPAVNPRSSKIRSVYVA
ncbi:hypothetical protein FRC08_008956, partial [Ceratobasidium sp. 394]